MARKKRQELTNIGEWSRFRSLWLNQNKADGATALPETGPLGYNPDRIAIILWDADEPSNNPPNAYAIDVKEPVVVDRQAILS